MPKPQKNLLYAKAVLCCPVNLLLCPGLQVALCGVPCNGRDAFGQLSLAESAALAALPGQLPAETAVPGAAADCCFSTHWTSLLTTHMLDVHHGKWETNLLLLLEAVHHTACGGRTPLKLHWGLAASPSNHMQGYTMHQRAAAAAAAVPLS